MRLEKESAEEEIYQSEFPKRAVKKSLSIGASLLGAGSLARIIPLLSGKIPSEIAYKGLIRVAPFLKKFFDKGFSKGLDLESGLDFLREKASQAKEEKLPEKEKKRRSALQQFNKIKKPSLVEEETERFNKYYRPQEAPQGQGSQALLEMLRQINQSLGQ